MDWERNAVMIFTNLLIIVSFNFCLIAISLFGESMAWDENEVLIDTNSNFNIKSVRYAKSPSDYSMKNYFVRGNFNLSDKVKIQNYTKNETKNLNNNANISFVPIAYKHSVLNYKNRNYSNYTGLVTPNFEAVSFDNSNLKYETRRKFRENYQKVDEISWLKKINQTQNAKIEKTLNNTNLLQNKLEKNRSLKIQTTWLPYHTMKNLEKNRTENKDMERITNKLISWSKIKPILPKSSGHKFQKNEKIKKLLNLFTIIKFDNGECTGDGLIGICLHQTECENINGKLIATCANGNGVCCYSEKTCGEHSKENLTYFVNQGFPEPFSIAPSLCSLTIEKITPDVSQLRLDFLNFQLREPSNGTCMYDRLIVTGQDTNNIIPEICGMNTGQHIYLDTTESKGPFKLNIVTMGEYFPRNFKIKITQLKMGDELESPKNCLQFYSEPTGVLQSFNYKRNLLGHLDTDSSSYFNNLNYVICIKKLPNICSISYENSEIESSEASFQIVNVDEDGEVLLPPLQAGAETFDCPNDYIIISGMRLCGEKLNDGSINLDFSKNYPVTDTGNGPFVLQIRTDGSVTGRGFSLLYKQNFCAN